MLIFINVTDEFLLEELDVKSCETWENSPIVVWWRGSTLALYFDPINNDNDMK